MKMAKSLFLGSAAGLVAVAGAQAADLPVKAKPVEYVKVCSAYGAGFYYIPGTDICLRVGGYVFSDFEINDYGAAPQNTSGALSANLVRNRNTDASEFRVRQDLILDARTNTEYGTLRSYVSVGWQWTTSIAGQHPLQLPASTGNYAWYYDRAFIQFAGLTFGYVGSFFDFDPSMVLNQQNSKSFKFAPAIAYTAQLGNGISASVSMEDGTVRRSAIVTAAATNLAGGSISTGSLIFGYSSGATSTTALTSAGAGSFVGIPVTGWGTNLYSGQFMPDFIANLRVDQAWGDAQISGAVHQLKAAVEAASTVGLAGIPGTGMPWAKDKYGYAALGGVNFKLPMLGAGDSVQVEGAWAKGAAEYTGISANPYQSNYAIGYRTGNTGPVLAIFDSFVDGTGQHLSTTYSLNAQLRHFWTPTIRSSVAYGYVKFKAPAQAQADTGTIGSVAAGLDAYPSGKIQQITANLIWSPVPKLDLGLEGIWWKESDDCGGLSAANCAADATRGKTTPDQFGGMFRARRDF